MNTCLQIHNFLLAVTKLVKAIVQVVGMQHSPHHPKGSDDIQGWFKEASLFPFWLEYMHAYLVRTHQVSYLAIPETHNTLLTKKATLRRYGVAKTFG
jgi:hypothetical protein